MDVVILAAGKNERLRGVVAPYHKPLLVVDGKPLILRAVEACKAFTDRIILVVAPENAHAIAGLAGSWSLSHRLHVVVQPEARGPGEALYRGLCVSSDRETLVICGDNIVPPADMEKFSYPQGARIGVGVRVTRDEEEAQRFSRLDPQMRFIEGRPGGVHSTGEYLCWLGPIRVPTTPTRVLLEKIIKQHKTGDGEIKIAENLNELNWEVVPISVECVDAGVPRVVQAVTK